MAERLDKRGEGGRVKKKEERRRKISSWKKKRRMNSEPEGEQYGGVNKGRNPTGENGTQTEGFNRSLEGGISK